MLSILCHYVGIKIPRYLTRYMTLGTVKNLRAHIPELLMLRKYRSVESKLETTHFKFKARSEFALA